VPTLTVVVPATDSPAALTRCTRAIEAADQPPEQLVVVDEPCDSGPAAARNAGVEAADGEVIVFVDADVEVHPDAFDRIRARFDSDPELTALFGSYDDRPEAPGLVSAFRNLLHHHVHQSSPGPASTFWAGLGAVRHGPFVEVGGFDSRRFPHASVEDIDLGMRLVRSGAKIVLDPRIQGRHLKAWTLANVVRTDFARRGVPWVRLVLEDSGDLSAVALNLGWRHRASAAACLVGFAALVRRRPRVAATAAASLLALNQSFYRLLARRSRALAAAGIPLHVVHHLTGVAAVPAGVTAHLLDRRGPSGNGNRPQATRG
jgi:GT2 family glycosyltransferase